MLPLDTPLPCSGRYDIFDALVDSPESTGRHHYIALREINDMCSRCPIQRSCWHDNADEPWRKVIHAAMTRRNAAA